MPRKKKDEKPEKPIEGEIVKEETTKPDRRVARTEPASPQEIAQWRPEFAKADVDRAIVQVEEKKRFFDSVMKSGSHYAIIPGQRPTPRINQVTGQPVKDAQGNALTDPPKPALLKPGAELLNAAMGLHPVLEDEYPPTMEERAGEMFIQFRRVCRIYRQTGPGEQDRMLVAQASGECNSWEPKYRYRGSGERVCPACGKAAIIKGRPDFAPTIDGKRGSAKKPEYIKGGFLCWPKKDGCGATYPDGDEEIVGQKTEREKNPDPMGVANTLLKMADKRALVAATLLATGCSDLFTQDIEEGAPSPEQEKAAATSTARTGDPGDGYEDPGPPSDAAAPATNEGAKQEPPKPAQTSTQASAERQKAGGVSDSEYAHLTGWPELTLFHRFSVSHADDPRVPLFRKYMNEHGFGKWSELAAKWNDKCHIDKDKEFGSTIAQEIATLISPLGHAPDKPMPLTVVK